MNSNKAMKELYKWAYETRNNGLGGGDKHHYAMRFLTRIGVSEEIAEAVVSKFEITNGYQFEISTEFPK